MIVPKYRIWINGTRYFAMSIPDDTIISQAGGFTPITQGAHYFHAFGPELYDRLPFSEKKKPAHFNPPFAELNV